MSLSVNLENHEASERLGGDLARALRSGDILALSGELGAGKSTLARAFIRAMADDPDLEVPSPTYTLVQSYPVRIPVSHFDLYRLGNPGDLDELGFAELGADGICLVEWPERAAGRLPENAINLQLVENGGGRIAKIDGPPEALARISRSLDIRAFLAAHGLGGAPRRWFQGDASARVFELVGEKGGASFVLMDNPEKPDLSPIVNGRSYRQTARITWTVTPFVAVASALRARGFAAPEITAADLSQGLLLMEYLGEGKFADELGRPVPDRYCAAAELLADLHVAGIERRLRYGDGQSYLLPPYDHDALMIEARLMLDWYLPYQLGRAAGQDEEKTFLALWSGLISRLANSQTGLLLRDYHSPNIIWRGEKSGHDRLGLVDIQDALWGPVSYDVSSLAQDARVTVAPELEERIYAAYCARRRELGDFDQHGFSEACAITALQRATKILGIFVRLDRRDGKPAYLKHLPRIENYVRRSLCHPALASMREFYSGLGLT